MCTVPVSTLNRRLTMLFDLGIFPGGSFLIRETTPRPGQAWRRVAESHGANASPLASNAVREIRSDPQRLLDDTPHLPNRKLTRCHHPPRIKTF